MILEQSLVVVAGSPDGILKINGHETVVTVRDIETLYRNCQTYLEFRGVLSKDAGAMIRNVPVPTTATTPPYFCIHKGKHCGHLDYCNKHQKCIDEDKDAQIAQLKEANRQLTEKRDEIAAQRDRARESVDALKFTIEKLCDAMQKQQEKEPCKITYIKITSPAEGDIEHAQEVMKHWRKNFEIVEVKIE